MSENTIITVGDQRVGYYQIDTIFDPDVDGPDPSIIEGKYVPKVNSAVCNNQNRLIRVASVDSRYKVTYGDFHVEPSDMDDILINYGNRIYTMRYDNKQTPTKLFPDGKVIIFHSNASFYKVFKEVNDIWTSIGIYIDSQGQIQGDQIPVVEDGLSGIKVCANCFTNINLSPGEVIKICIYNTVGEEIEDIKLITAPATIIDELPDTYKVITGFRIESSQMRGDEIVIYANQDPTEVGIYPVIVFDDGSTETLDINNKNCFLYGVLEITPPYIGTRYKIICKYYPMNMAAVNDLLTLPGYNHITAEGWVVVDSKEIEALSKISLVPGWVPDEFKWDFALRGYMNDRSTPLDVTTAVQWNIPINPTLFNTEQNYSLDIIEKGAVVFSQDGKITLKNSAFPEPYVIDLYGAAAPDVPRPVVVFDNGYKIPQEQFMTVDVFLEAFYYNAQPPYDTIIGESAPPIPTHFILRDRSTGTMMVPEVIELTQYLSDIQLIEDVSGKHQGEIVVVEFLVEDGTDYHTIYGVPVTIT